MKSFSKQVGLYEDTAANKAFQGSGLTSFMPTQKVQIPSMTDDAKVEVTVFQTPPPPEGVSTGRLYADGSMNVSTLLETNVWHNMTIPRRVLELYSLLANQCGVTPIATENRTGITSVTTQVFTTSYFNS